MSSNSNVANGRNHRKIGSHIRVRESRSNSKSKVKVEVENVNGNPDQAGEIEVVESIKNTYNPEEQLHKVIKSSIEIDENILKETSLKSSREGHPRTDQRKNLEHRGNRKVAFVRSATRRKSCRSQFELSQDKCSFILIAAPPSCCCCCHHHKRRRLLNT
jgi:hypothetical protein